MWTQCTVDKILPIKQGTNRTSGEQYKLRDIDLDFLDYDDQGKPAIDKNNHYVHSKVRVSAFGDLADFIEINNIQPGNTLWAELHFYIEGSEDRNGVYWTRNKISLRSLRL